MTISGVVTVPVLSTDDKPLAVVLHETGHGDSSHRYIGWTLVGFVDSDEHGGTRVPVTLSGTELGQPVYLNLVFGETDTTAAARSLCSFLSNDAERKSAADGGRWVEDPLPDYTPEQWELLSAEGERLGCFAAE